MSETVHQIWLGGAMPPRLKAWTDSARQWAAAMGMEYKLWGEAELWQTFGNEPELATLRICMEALPTATSYAFASDYFRLRLVAEFGGLYLDADTRCGATIEVPPEGLYCASEVYKFHLESNWLQWAVGETGRRAARVLWEAARAHFNRILPPGAADIPSRFVQIARRDIPGNSIAAAGVGPGVLRRVMIPHLRKQGMDIHILPQSVASCRNNAAPLRQCCAWTWNFPNENWEARARAARWQEHVAALPPQRRPQSARCLPASCRTLAVARQVAQAAFTRPHADGLIIPRGVQRVLVFSNVPGLDVGAVGIRRGDLCIHLNTARHYEQVRQTPGTWHTLLVRGGKRTENGQSMRIWYEPPSTKGMGQVLHIDDAPMRALRPWWRQYCTANPGKSPTSGFIAWHLAREAAPGIPVVLVGFAPGERWGTPIWQGHAWQYEAKEYARAKADILPPGKISKKKEYETREEQGNGSRRAAGDTQANKPHGSAGDSVCAQRGSP